MTSLVNEAYAILHNNGSTKMKLRPTLLHALRLLCLTPLLLTGVPVQAQQVSVPPEKPIQDEWDMGEWAEPEQQTYRINGYVEAAVGWRISDDPVINGRSTLADLRAQLQVDRDFSQSRISLSADVYYDGVLDQAKAQVRELAWQGNLSSLGQWGTKIDAKLGQQVLTWGTGDYVFLNDLFAKDFQSFFAGRDDEYLKAPSLSAKFSGYFDWANIDVVLTPEFTPDNYINGDYFSFFSPQYSPISGTNVAPSFNVTGAQLPSSPEYAVRISKSLGSTELALYGYRGFYKSPSSMTDTGQPYFSALRVYGASAITPFAQGLFNAEFAYYDSTDDEHGSHPQIPNSQARYLLGYEQELIKNLTGSVQWYLEHTAEYAALVSHSLTPEFEPARSRIVVTQRLMYRALQQTLTFNAFNFYSTSDADGYLKFSTDYSPTDDWRLTGGVNVFYGDQPHTFFNQFSDASNAFIRLRLFY
jgi:hypothetical protein